MPIIRHGYATHTRNGSTRQWRTTRQHTLNNATHCAICHQPLGNEPAEAHHTKAYADHGHNSPIVAAHRSCNRRHGR